MDKKQFESELLDRYGELIGGVLLSKVLGYASLDAMKMAIKRGTLNLTTFLIDGRRGRFALTIDVADWLIKCKTNTKDQNKSKPSKLNRNKF